ncbi:bidirectional hydrogenase complex protein HoxE [Desulfogranum japonicum]|uniref:bidirectional hydrogenase complex protein HoxE n=1 Tax=Desulfogranum japonicum TaxID=231447 RepID=UPI0003FD1081|nr:bidirectional hydrogenase complex protein HoxE [Desulfogranum japonicum]
MQTNAEAVDTPLDSALSKTKDPQYRMVNRIMCLHNYQPDALIETLHAAQDSFGCITLETMRYISHMLHLPLSRVYAVATFYHYFTLKPPGKHRCVLCMGTACYIAGAESIEKAITEKHHISPGETTSDGEISLLTARCLGSCGLAPAAIFDDKVMGQLTPKNVLKQLQDWRDHVADT